MSGSVCLFRKVYPKTSFPPEPLSAIFLPVKTEQDIPFPLRLPVVGRDDNDVLSCIAVMCSIYFVFTRVFYKYSTNVNKPIGINNFFNIFFLNFFLRHSLLVPSEGFEPSYLGRTSLWEMRNWPLCHDGLNRWRLRTPSLSLLPKLLFVGKETYPSV